MKRNLVFILVFVQVMFCCVPTAAMVVDDERMILEGRQEKEDTDTVEGNIIYYSDRKISEVNSLEKVTGQTVPANPYSEFTNPGQGIYYTGSFYSEYPVRYEPDNTKEVDEGFEIARLSFDTRTDEELTDVTFTYNKSQTVSWTVSGTVTGETEFGIIGQKVKASLSVSVARSSSTSEAIGVTVTKRIRPGKTGYIKMYARGVMTYGALVYKWRDRCGNSGEREQFIRATLPLERIEGCDIHIGPLNFTN